MDRIGHYELIKVVGEGQYSTVHLAIDLNTDEKVAVKETESYDGIEVLSELDVLTKVSHPNIIPIYEIFFDIDFMYYSMPLADCTLEKFIKESDLTFDHRLRLVYEILSAFDFLHSHGIYHCDIRVDNILLFNDHIFVADFSVASTIEYSSRCMTDSLLPPEASGEDKDKIHSRDKELWALGLVILFIFTGKIYIRVSQYTNITEEHRRFSFKIFEEIKLSSSIKKLLMRMLNTDPEVRFKSIKEISEYLEFDLPIPGKILTPEFIAPIINDEQQKMCYKLIHWLLEVAADFKLNLKTLISGIDLFYRVLTSINPKRTELQLLGVTCVWMTSKIYQRYPPVVEDIVEMTANAYTKEEVVHMEERIVLACKGMITTDLPISLELLQLMLDAQEYVKVRQEDIELEDDENEVMTEEMVRRILEK